MLLVPIISFPLQDALEGSTFLLGRLFHTERSLHAYQFTVVFVSGRQDLPSDARAFSLNSFVACVASVSSRVIARKLDGEQKKMEWGGGGGGEKR